MLTRRAFTLLELVIALVLACAIGTAAMRSLAGEQRIFSAAARRNTARAALHQAADVLTTDLRSLSPRDGDLYVAAPDHVEFRLLLGSSVLCTITPARDAATLPPTRAASALGLTAWVASPQAGDTLLVFDPGGPGLGDDRWTRHVLTSDPTPGAACPVASGLTSTAAEALAGWGITIRPPLAPTVPVGAPIRFFRRARFELYRAADTRWYLGFYDCLATRATPCAIVQPVAGPFEPAGLTFTFLDSLGAPAIPTGTSRIGIELHASAAGSASGAAFSHDSLRTVVAMRE